MELYFLFHLQVYKVVVTWTDGKEIIIYRKYSFFFDFVVSASVEIILTRWNAWEMSRGNGRSGQYMFGRASLSIVQFFWYSCE